MTGAQIYKAAEILKRRAVAPDEIVQLTELGSEGCVLRIGANVSFNPVERIMIARDGVSSVDEEEGWI